MTGVSIMIDPMELALKAPSYIMHCVFVVRKKTIIDLKSEILMGFLDQKKPFDKISVEGLFEETDCVVTFHKLTLLQHTKKVRLQFRQKCEQVLSRHNVESKFIGFLDPRSISTISS